MPSCLSVLSRVNLARGASCSVRAYVSCRKRWFRRSPSPSLSPTRGLSRMSLQGRAQKGAAHLTYRGTGTAACGLTDGSWACAPRRQTWIPLLPRPHARYSHPCRPACRMFCERSIFTRAIPTAYADLFKRRHHHPRSPCGPGSARKLCGHSGGVGLSGLPGRPAEDVPRLCAGRRAARRPGGRWPPGGL